MQKFLFRALLILIVGAILFVGGGWLAFQNLSVSDGNRTGTLYKFSHKGVLIKTWEGSLITGGFNPGNAQPVGMTWDFSVADQAVATQLNQAIGKPVELTYQQKMFKLSWMGDTDYFITAVKVLEK